MEQELYRIFGGYDGYMQAPYWVVQRHRLVVIARWSVEGEQQAEMNQKLKELESRTG